MEDFTLFDYLFSLEVDSVDYKNPAQVLKTLVREKKTKYRESSFLDLLNGRDGSWEDVFRVTRKLLSECKVAGEDVDMTPITRFIDDSILSQISFRKATYHEEEIAYRTTKSRNAVVAVIGDKAKVGVLDKKLRNKWDCGTAFKRLRTYSEWVEQIDLIRFCSELIVYSEMLRYYNDKLQGRTADELKENVVFAKHIPRRASLKEEELELIDWCKQFGIEVDISRHSYHPDIYTYLNGLPVEVKFVNYITLNIFKDIVEEYNLEKRREKYLREVNGDYALSFMDLKNKPEKFIEAANNSAFKKFFGGVEYDPDCDLLKLAELEKEFLAIIPQFKVSLSKAVIRFRKLGNHKAIGLYYPAVKCLCVDIRAPRSFVHELFHLIDWESDELSLKYDFFEIRKGYEKELRKTLSSMDDNSLKKKLSGSSKYSIDYYLEPSEIFARCGEVYAYKKMGIRNSLAKIDNFTEFGYDLSDELYAKVESYFDIILGGEGYGNIHDKVAAGV